MPKVLPSLSTDNWTEDPVKIGDYLISHFILSDFSQSQIYAGKISSLPYLLNEHQKDVGLLVRGVEETLTTYFSRYFDNVEVEVLETDNPDNSSDVSISIYLAYIQDNKEYNLSRLIHTTNSKISKVIDISNG